MKLRHGTAKPSDTAHRPVAGVAAMLLLPAVVALGCDSSKQPLAEPHQQARSKYDDGPAYRPKPAANAPASAAYSPPAPAGSIIAAPAIRPVQPRSCPRSLDAALAMLRQDGHDAVADVISARVSQEKPKRRLTPEQGLHACCYALGDLPRMPSALRLSVLMPKTTIELLIAARERGVPRTEAEGMAAYMLRLRESMGMQNPKPFDENTSHVIGRQWHEIDYSGEGMTWQGQMDFYAPKGVPDFRSEASLRRFFGIEAKMPYFKRLYRPQGALPGY
jgi:hypothetical protein